MNDWTDKINVENGEYIHGMENDGDTKEAEPSKARHLHEKSVDLTMYQCVIDRGRNAVSMVLVGFAWRNEGQVLIARARAILHFRNHATWHSSSSRGHHLSEIPQKYLENYDTNGKRV